MSLSWQPLLSKALSLELTDVDKLKYASCKSNMFKSFTNWCGRRALVVSKLKRKLKGFVSHNTEKYAKGLLKVLRRSHFSFSFSQFNWSWSSFILYVYYSLQRSVNTRNVSFIISKRWPIYNAVKQLNREAITPVSYLRSISENTRRK